MRRRIKMGVNIPRLGVFGVTIFNSNVMQTAAQYVSTGPANVFSYYTFATYLLQTHAWTVSINIMRIMFIETFLVHVRLIQV